MNENESTEPAPQVTPEPTQAAATPAEPVKKVKKPLSVDDAEYLSQYLKISENFLGGGITIDTAKKRLKKLNAEFKGKIAPRTKRIEVAGDNLATYDGWAPSQVCY